MAAIYSKELQVLTIEYPETRYCSAVDRVTAIFIECREEKK